MDVRQSTAQASISSRRQPFRTARAFMAKWARLSENLRNMRDAEKTFSLLSQADFLFELDAKKTSFYSAKLSKDELRILQGKDNIVAEANALYGAITPGKAAFMAAVYKRTAKIIRVATTSILGALGAGTLIVGISLPDLVPIFMGGAFLAAGAIFNLGFPKFDVKERARWIMGVLEKAAKQVPS